MIATFLALLTFVVLQEPPSKSGPAPPQSGTWRAWLDCPGGEIPFELVLARQDEDWRGSIVNGAERKEIARVAWEGSELVLDIADFDSTIRAKTGKGGARLDGAWRKRAGADRWAELPFHATFGPAPRFAHSGPITTAATDSVAGRWAVKFASEEDEAVGVFEIHDEGVVSGTFLTTTGDYRFLAGLFDGKRLQLSAFDGAHAFLFDARLLEEGSLKGDFWSRDAFHDTWTAKKDPGAKLPDAFTLTKRTDDYDLAKLSFPDLQGKPRTLADSALRGKARIIEVFGSWCPNCHDASNYLVDLYGRMRPRGLSVVGLAFELTGDAKRDTEQVRKFAELHKVEYPLLIAGISDREKATAALPMLDKLRAYPTLIVLDGKGKVRAIYTGFSGPATGEAYEAFQTKFESIIEELLTQP